MYFDPDRLIDQKNLTLNAICNYLENTIPASCATEYKGNAVLFINLDLCTLTIHEISDKIEGFIKSSMLSAGYSRKMLGHFNFHRQYTQASVTLQVGNAKIPQKVSTILTPSLCPIFWNRQPKSFLLTWSVTKSFCQ